MTTSTTRRTFLRAAPALLAPGLLASGAIAQGMPMMGTPSAETPILRLFREWDRLQTEWVGLSDEESDSYATATVELERRVVAEPVTSLADLAAKLIVSSAYGDFRPAAAVFAEAEAILAEGLA